MLVNGTCQKVSMVSHGGRFDIKIIILKIVKISIFDLNSGPESIFPESLVSMIPGNRRLYQEALQIEDHKCNWPTKPNLGSGYHRQEKPDLQKPPESAPAGILVAHLVTLPLANTLLISGLLHALQVTEEMSEDGRILSKILPH